MPMHIAPDVDFVSTVTGKGQTTIPKAIREAMGIARGTPLRWALRDGVVQVRAKSRRLEDFVAMTPPDGRHLSAPDMGELATLHAALKPTGPRRR